MVSPTLISYHASKSSSHCKYLDHYIMNPRLRKPLYVLLQYMMPCAMFFERLFLLILDVETRLFIRSYFFLLIHEYKTLKSDSVTSATNSSSESHEIKLSTQRGCGAGCWVHFYNTFQNEKKKKVFIEIQANLLMAEKKTRELANSFFD